MKLPTLKKTKRVDTQDAMGHGMDAVFMLVLFLGAGYALDRAAGTMPVFMILMTLLGSVGLFLKFKYRYEERMDELDAQRLGKHASAQPDGAEHAA
jgi:F0F1-type ATP synthase assembly protein I|tara:strand:- start:407 stop:694 length:288 start_codon:yes stop_codon:yes gene_type:complete